MGLVEGAFKSPCGVHYLIYAMDCKPTKKLPVQEKFKFKCYLALPIFPSIPCPLCFREDLQFTPLNLATRVDSISPPLPRALPSILEFGKWDGQELVCCQATKTSAGYTPSLIYSYRKVRISPAQIKPFNTLSCPQWQSLCTCNSKVRD